MDSDVIKLGALLNVFEVRLRSRESKLVLVHVGDMPQDVLAAALGYHLSGERKRKRGSVRLGCPEVVQTHYSRLAAQVASEGNEASCRGANRCQPGETQREPEAPTGNPLAKLCMWLFKIL